MPHSFFFLFLNFRASSGNTSLQRPIMKVENMLFNVYSQHIPLLSPNHTHREALTMRNRQAPVATVSGDVLCSKRTTLPTKEKPEHCN